MANKFILLVTFLLVVFLSPRVVFANLDTIKILPIIVIPNDASKLLTEFGQGNDRIKMGFSIGFEYLGTEYLGNQFTYPNLDHIINLSHLESMSAKAVETSLPFLVHFPGHRWSVADYIAQNKTTMMYTYDGKAVTELPEWTDPNQPMAAIPTYRIGSYLYSLNEYNGLYRFYKKRNLQAAATFLANFSKIHPELFAGVSLDSEISFCPAGFPGWKNYEYSFDYNPLTIVQWRHWLSGNSGSYTNGTYPNPYSIGSKFAGKGKNWNLEQLKVRYQTNYQSWDYVAPPNITLDTTGNIKILFGNQAIVDDWLEFKASLTNNMLKDMIDWVAEAGIPRSQIYSHQPMTVYEFPDLNRYCGIPYESAQVAGAGYGTTVYGDMVLSVDFFQRIANLNSNWGIFEWNPTNLNNSTNQTATFTTQALQLAYDKGADIIAPNYYVSSSPKFPIDPLELNGNIGYTQGLKQFIVNNPPASIQQPGDANGDTYVDGIDFIIWMNNFSKIISGYSFANFNGDAIVDGRDFMIWMNNFGN